MTERHPENIVICIDTSRSMYRTDYAPNRLISSVDAIKKLISERFVQDASSSFAAVNFSDKPKKIIDFTNDKKKLFEALVEDEERHFDQYDVEMENLKKFGDNYLALQSIERSKNIAAGRPTE